MDPLHRQRVCCLIHGGFPEMEDVMAAISEVGLLLDNQYEAIRTRDIDRLMAVYSPDIVYFDAVPPLQYVGSAALRDRFQHWFDGWKSAIGMEIRELKVSASEDVAAGHMLVRSSGTLVSGQEVARWVRATSVCQRSAHGWLIVHEHISLPVDFATGRAAMHLVP